MKHLLADSHCHLDQLDLNLFSGDVANILQQAKEYQVGYFLNVCIDLQHFPDVMAITNQFENVWSSVGLHPNEQVEKEPEVNELIQLARKKKIVALGETGLDYYRTAAESPWQIERFEKHIAAAKAVKKPLIIHSRQAPKDTVEVLKRNQAQDAGGVFHCFTEDWETAKAALDLGFYISFSGIITFKNAQNLRDIAAKLPLDRILVETDSPYLAPDPFRGKPNQSAYVKYVAETIAAVRNIDFDTVAMQTTANFKNLFKV